MSIFRAYDIRGIYKKDITEAVMLKLGKALGTFLKGNKNIAVGYDTRISSKRLFDSLAKGLISTGCNVINLGMVPNPMVYFYAWKNKTFGVMITASHNPKEWNGLKIVRPRGVSFIKELEEIEKVYKYGKFLKGKGEITKGIVKEPYKKFLKRKLGFNRKKVVVECFGTVGVIALPILKELGLDVISLHDKPDGKFFGFERPEPKGHNLNILKKTVKREEVDFGAAFDGDADRAVFIDDKGRELNGSIMSAIFIEYILEKRRRGRIVITPDCASEIDKIIEDSGGRTVWGRVGHGFIERRILYEKALFAGEQSSHFYFNEFYPFSDGILAILYLAKLLSKKGEKLSKIVNRIKMYPIEKIYINVRTDDNKKKVMKKIKKKYHDAKKMMDGIKIQLNKTEWVLIRASQTLPEINLCVEAKTKTRLRDLIQKYSKIIRKEI
jgi:phosphomannomutase/phosphoglucomutase